jgi:carbon monoxide dehydrogenase subunit G
VGLKAGGSVSIEQRVAAPPEKVSAYVSDFRNARDWMVGVERVEPMGEDTYRLALDSPIGRIEPEVRILENTPESIS